MKTLLQMLALLLPVTLMAATDENPLSGTLTDKATGDAIAGAVITIENSYIYTTTDEHGRFSFDHLKDKSVTLHVNHIAYESFTETVTLPSEALKVEMLSKNYMSDAVTVTATRAN